MYRYSPHMRGTPTGGNRMRDRIRTVFIFLLIIALGVSMYYAISSTAYRREAHALFVERMQAECNNALTQTNKLSRTASASDRSVLSLVRSHVYSMETINNLNLGLEGAGGYLIEEAYFTNLYSILDSYSNKLITGMTTGDDQTSLLTTLQELYARVELLE